MAKPVAPLISFDARGTVGKTAVYASWRGRSYVRRYVVPSNPQSASQTQTRSVFAWLTQVWKLAPTIFQAPWTAFAKGQVFTDRNAYNSKNVGTLRTATDLSDLVFTPGSGGGIALTSAVFTAGVTNVTVTATPPTAPAGWSVTAVQAAVIKDQDPQTEFSYNITAGEDLVTPFSIILAGLSTGVLYRGAAWIKWAKPDGSVAYGPQTTGSFTPA